MLKHRYGSCLSEPVSVNFNPACFFVGEEVENVQFGGDFSFLKSDTVEASEDDFDEF